MDARHDAGVRIAAWRDLARLGLRSVGGAKEIAREMLASQSSKDTVGDPIRQHIRPLIDGLVGDADCLCGGRNGPAENFDGFGLEHGLLNHSSALHATVVQGLTRTLATMVDKTEFKDRLLAAMKAANASINDVATACDISYQAVVKLTKGASKEMTGSNLAATAKLLKVDPIWLAIGEGEARPQPISTGSLKPMEAQMLTMYRLLPAELQHEVDSEINSKVAGRSNAPGPANPFGKQPTKPAQKPRQGDKAHKADFDLSQKKRGATKGRRTSEA
jgi:transcriptional regulator with XRE-family HTH domain